MNKPDLDRAMLGDRKWAWLGKCWWEWSRLSCSWIPAHDPPPPEARFCNYRRDILGIID